MIRYKNERGTVELEAQVFGMIAMETALEMEGIYAVTNARGRVIHLKEPGKEAMSFIEVRKSEEKNGIDIRIYVVTSFGKSIKETAEEYGERTRQIIKEITGVMFNQLTLVVTGVKSKKIARREMEISC